MNRIIRDLLKKYQWEGEDIDYQIYERDFPQGIKVSSMNSASCRASNV